MSAMARPVVRFGVVGTGFGAAVHIPALRLSAHTDVVAVCSSSRERAEGVARRFQIPYACADYRDLVRRPEVDAVTVAVPPNLHYPVTMAALDAGKHVLCEKPLAANLAEASAMCRRAQAAGVTHMVHHEFRYRPSWAKLKELIDAGYLGQLFHASFSAFYHQDRLDRPWDWHARHEDGGGVFNARGSHAIDALRYWFGELTGCFGWLETFVRRRRVPSSAEWRPVTSDDAFAFTVSFRGGGRAVAQLNAATRFGQGIRIEAYGSEGTLILGADNTLYGARAGDPGLSQIPLPPQEVPAEDLVTPPDRIDFGQFLEDRGPEHPGFIAPSARYQASLIYEALHLLRRFVGGVRGEGAPAPSFTDGVRCQEAMDAVRLSAREGRWVDLPLAEGHHGRPAGGGRSGESPGSGAARE